MNTPTTHSRHALRKEILAQREAMPPQERTAKSFTLTTIVWQMPIFQQADTIFFYVNFRSEVETIPLIQQCLDKKKRVAVPLTRTKDARLIAYEITDIAQDLEAGYCDIPEPVPDKCKEIDPGGIDVVILPGSVFDHSGGRLGYGGGYYDRFLVDQAPQALRIGLAFELQVVKELPLLPHDQSLDYLVTEKRVLQYNK